MPDVFVGMVVGPGLRKTAVVTCASARLYPLRAHLGSPAGLRLRTMGPGAPGGQRNVIEIHPNFLELAVGPKAIPAVGADPQRPPAGNGPAFAGRSPCDGQRLLPY